VPVQVPSWAYVAIVWKLASCQGCGETKQSVDNEAAEPGVQPARGTGTEVVQPLLDGNREGANKAKTDFFWEAYLSIKVPLTRLDPAHP
jgi:hypothetical protein